MIRILMSQTAMALSAAVLAAVLSLPARADNERRGGANSAQVPLVIGHRGAPGYLPEHTLESYALAIALGADYIEPDLVATKDGVLIARHEPNMIGTTNVASIAKFAGRKKTVMVDGVPDTGFFASDFTLAEIKELGAIQSFGERDPSFNGRFKIPTLDEVIELAKRKTRESGRTIGIYPETKHPTYHQGIGLALEDRLLSVLSKAGWNHRNAPVFIQSFETANLRYLRSKTKVKLVQLIDADDVNADGSLSLVKPYDKPYDWVVGGRPGLFSDLVTPAGLNEVSTYADGIGPWKPYLMSSACVMPAAGGGCADANGDGLVDERDRKLLPPSPVMANAKALGLLVHPYTMRNEPRRLASNYKGNPINEYLAFYEMGVDGMFSDFPDTSFAARAMYLLKRDAGYADCLVNGKGCGKSD